MRTAGHLGQKILVVEDNQLVTRSLATLLRDEGYEPVVFSAGVPALAYLRNNRPDIALIDIHLPDISGFELSQELRKTHGSDLPIIILSGDTSMDTIRALPDAQATYFCSKPVNTSVLIGQLREWLGISAIQL